ncbi:hypothetical protein NDU88_002672 [Pleurodeles waltl]|uniref:Uncharacterized protein n=1 Tax=Pleurodeles waltl TaxID=8319 RepID=A0AAV7UBI8_PLEWA|nr:hypothetical protein NDU88_002672 [Pleurodeles waltl]
MAKINPSYVYLLTIFAWLRRGAVGSRGGENIEGEQTEKVTPNACLFVWRTQAALERLQNQEQPERVVPIPCIRAACGVRHGREGGFETSNINQKAIGGLSQALGEKIDDLAVRTSALEEEVEDLRMAMD